MSETENSPEPTEPCPQCGLPGTAPRNPPMSVEVGVCSACGQAPLAADVQSLYGPDTNPGEHRRKLTEYRSELARLQERLREEGLSPSYQEAVDLVQLYPWPDPEDPEAWATFGLVLDCVEEEDGRQVLIEEHVREWLEVWQDESERKWDRFWVQEALEEIARRVPDHPLATEILERLESGRLNRPSGRYDPRKNEVRDVHILKVLDDLVDLDMNPTRHLWGPKEESACDAVATARGLFLSYTGVESVWKRRPHTETRR